MTFIDTNVLVYAATGGSPFERRSREAVARAAADGAVSVSRQILREYLAVMTRQQTWGKPLSIQAAVTDTALFSQRFTVLEDGPPVWDRLMQLARRHPFGGRQVHDANIVATMLAHGERRLLTFNDADFRRFADAIEIVVP